MQASLHSLALKTERQRKTAELVLSWAWVYLSSSHESEPVDLVVLNDLKQFPTVGQALIHVFNILHIFTIYF